MSSIAPGEKVPLVAQLECPEAATLYVEAIIKRPSRAVLPGSPVDLTDEGNGVFFDDSITMPDESFITVTYNVYEDAAKTQPAEDYCSTTITITRAAGGSGQVIVTNTPDRIVGRVRDSRIDAKINDHGPHKILISDPDNKAELLDEQHNLRENENSHIIRSQ